MFVSIMTGSVILPLAGQNSDPKRLEHPVCLFLASVATSILSALKLPVAKEESGRVASLQGGVVAGHLQIIYIKGRIKQTKSLGPRSDRISHGHDMTLTFRSCERFIQIADFHIINPLK